MGFILPLNNSQSQHTKDNGQGQTVARQGKCHQWVGHRKSSLKLNEKGGQLPHS